MSGKNDTATARTTRRRRGLTVAVSTFALIGLGYGAYWAQVLRYHQTTDDAYVGGNVVEIM